MTKRSSLANQWVCISGGSSGLGFDLARKAVMLDANVAIIGRDKDRLAKAAQKLMEIGKGQILSFSIDLSQSSVIQHDDRQAWLDWLSQANLAIAIQAIGKSDRGYLEQLSCEDLQSQLSTNLFPTLEFSKACFASLQRNRGTIVHIGSLAGIVATPGMGGYSISKHAVVAASRQLRNEWADHGVKVMLVCPGPIHRPDDGQRYLELVNERHLPTQLSKPGGGAKLSLLDADSLCEQIFHGIATGEKEIITPSKVRWLAAIAALFPSIADFLIRKNTGR